MTPDLFRKLRRNSKPFTVRLINGSEYHVSDPYFAALRPDKATMLLPSDDGLFDVVRLSQIESVRVADEPAA